MDFFLLLLVSYGLAFGLMNDKTPLSGWFRNRQFGKDEEGLTWFTRLLSCPYCTGFHTGYLAWLLTHLPQYIAGRHPFDVAVVTEVVGAAFASSAFCYLVDTAAQWLEDSSAEARASLDE